MNDKSVPAMLRALQTQAAVAEFIATHQGADPETVQRHFHEFAGQLNSLPTPPAGSLGR